MADIASTLSRHELVGFDTSIFIYQIDESPRYDALMTRVFDDLDQRRFSGVTSVITLMEICVRPLQLGRPDIADIYSTILRGYTDIHIVDVNPTVARRASELRAAYRLLPADALQVGTALEHQATAFLTNDRGLRRITELETILLDEYIES